MKRFKVMALALLVSGLSVAAAPPAQAQSIVSRLGGVCIDAEGGVREGARLLGYPCHGGANQQFEFVNSPNTRLRVKGTGLCASSEGRQQGAEIRLRQCDMSAAGNARQNFGWWSMDAIGHNSGFVMDLSGGWGGQVWSSWSGQTQPIVLWRSHGGENQQWRFADPPRPLPLARIPNSQPYVVPGHKGLLININGRPHVYPQGCMIQSRCNVLAVDPETLIGLGDRDVKDPVPPSIIFVR